MLHATHASVTAAPITRNTSRGGTGSARPTSHHAFAAPPDRYGSRSGAARLHAMFSAPPLHTTCAMTAEVTIAAPAVHRSSRARGDIAPGAASNASSVAGVVRTASGLVRMAAAIS